MKKILLLMLLLVNVWAVDVAKLHKAHRKALNSYSKNHNATKAFTILQVAGIKKVLKLKPKTMKMKNYIHLLNDFAFFRYESTAFKKQTRITPKFTGPSKPFIGDERMQKFNWLSNPYRRLNRLCDAKRTLQRVIKLDPERAVAYLNLGDVYWRTSLYYAKYMRSGDGRSNQGRPGPDIFTCQGSEKQSDNDVFKAFEMYALYSDTMIKQGKKKKIPKRINELLNRDFYYTVIEDRYILLGDDDICMEYAKALSPIKWNSEIDWHGTRGTGRAFIDKNNTKFERIPFSSLPKPYQLHFKEEMRLSGNSIDADPDQVYKYKNNIYIDLRTGALYLVNLDPYMIKMHGKHLIKCDYQLLNLKTKIRAGR